MNQLQGGVVLLVGAMLTLLLLVIVRKLPAARKLREGNELTGMYVAAIAAIYAVLLGFTVLAVWTRFDQAEARTEEEAATLATVARLAHSLPPDRGGGRVIAACRAYAHHVIDDEWQAMAERKQSHVTHEALDRLWDAVLAVKVTAPQDTPVVSEAVNQMTELSRLRQLRLLASRSGFPPLLWTLLLAGAGITTATSLLLWSPSIRQHAFQATCLWIVIALSLLATGELAAPFQGGVRIDPEAFRTALIMMVYRDHDASAIPAGRQPQPDFSQKEENK